MATAVTADPDLYYHSFPIEKMETDPATGTLYVYGKATTPEVDSDEQIVDPDWSAKAMEAWFQTGPNVRVQHNAALMPAGSGVKVEIDRDGDRAHWVKAAIDEPVARMMCEKGHLRAFSVGIAKPLIVRDVTGKARGGIIKGGELAEISLVDRPANRGCYVELAKAAGPDGHAEFTGKVGGADLLVKSLADDLDDPEFAAKVGPHGYVHGWIHEGGPAGAPDRKPANKMTREELEDHLGNYHGGGPVVGRRTGPKRPSKAQLVAAHERMHEALENGGAIGNMVVDQGVAHTHGMSETGKTVTVELPEDVSVSFSPGDLAKLLDARREAEARMVGKDWTAWDEAHQGEQRQAAGQKPYAHQLHVMHEVHEQHAAHEHAEHEAHTAHTAHDAHLAHEEAEEEAEAAARRRSSTGGSSSKPAAKPAPHETTAGNLAHANAITAETAGKAAGRDEVDEDDATSPAEPEPRKPPTRAKPMDDDPQETDPAAHGKLDDAQRSGPGAKSTTAQSAKRDFDPNVGGGTDRDKIPDSDFAGRDRSYPIKTPQDVSDAATSVGRAGDDNYGPDKLRANITRIAHRKGPDFAARLPESWQSGAGKAASVDTSEGLTVKGEECGLCKGTGKIREGHVKCPRCKGTGTMGGSAEAEVEKAGKRACKECGKNHHADFDGSHCEGCGAKLPPARKASDADAGAVEDADLAKGKDDDDGGDLAEDDDESGDDPDDGEDDGDDDDESPEDDDDEDDQASDAKASKAGKPSPGDGVRGEHTTPVPKHREPDGQAIESLEHDARLPTDPDRDYEKAAHSRFKTLGVPGDLGRLHDLTCAAYHPADVAKAHPGATLANVVDTDEWARAAFTAATSAPLDEAAKSQVLWQDAVMLKAADPIVLAEVGEAVHKAFQDANPGPGHAPTPCELSPGRFNRPYITAGHAAPSPGHKGPNTARVPASDITAAEFGRGALTADHAADSPSNKSGRLFYRNTARDQVHQALAAIHDHIAQTFPSLCPMAGSGDAAAAAPAAEGRKSASAGDGDGFGGQDADGLAYDAEGTRKWLAEQVIKGDMDVHEAREVLGLPPLGFPASGYANATGVNDWTGKAARAGAYSPDLIKSAVTEATRPLLDQLAEQGETLARQGRLLRKQGKTLDALAEAPDTGVAPYRGPAFPNPASMAPVGSIENPTVTKAAERSQMAVMRNLADEWRNSPDPAMRERAWQALSGQLGIAGNGTTHQ